MILKKLGDEYKLYSHDSCIATTYESPYKKLSLKNCQAIANGYEFDEIRKLADEDFECELGDGPTTNESINSMIKKSNANGAEWGFQKALEILGDKKFTEEDVKFMFQLGFNLDNAISRNEYNAHIQSLQQTEWDVEIEMENSLTNGYKNQPDNVIGFIAEYKSIPKLDSDGCLILKRK